MTGVGAFGSIGHFKGVGAWFQTGVAYRVFSGRQYGPFVIKSLHPVTVVSLYVAFVGQRRETDGKRFVRLVQTDAAGL